MLVKETSMLERWLPTCLLLGSKLIKLSKERCAPANGLENVVRKIVQLLEKKSFMLECQNTKKHGTQKGMKIFRAFELQAYIIIHS